jgi:hypothetical protein
VAYHPQQKSNSISVVRNGGSTAGKESTNYCRRTDNMTSDFSSSHSGKKELQYLKKEGFLGTAPIQNYNQALSPSKPLQAQQQQHSLTIKTQEAM